MAIHSAPSSGDPQSAQAVAAPPPPQLQFLPPHIAIDQNTSTFVLSPSSVTVAPSTLTIPLDIPNPDDLRRQRPPPGLTVPQTSAARKERPPRPERIPINRDSLGRREELLHGKPGTRRRQRWENDRLLSNPYLTPPTPADFLPTPTHTTKVVHYDLACLWESQYRKQHLQRLDKKASERAERNEPSIPRELRASLKRARGAAGMVRMLEERVREFVEKATAAASGDVNGNTINNRPSTSSSFCPHEEGWEVVDHTHGNPSDDEHELDEDDQEVIVFKPKKLLQKQQLPSLPTVLPVYHSPPTDPSAPFIRWLVHSIAEYYGLHSWSVTEKHPPLEGSAIQSSSSGDADVNGKMIGEVRVAYVGLHQQQKKKDEQQKGKSKTKTKTKTKSKSKSKSKKKSSEDLSTQMKQEEEEKGHGKEQEQRELSGLKQVKLPVKLPRPLWLML